jgi:acetyl-CoA synthetase
VNFAAEILESFPASRPALLAIDAEGERRVWHFGELSAQSAGLSGALAARGVDRGDVVLMLIGNRHEWVLSMLASWRMGAIALPCNVQLRRADLAQRIAATNPRLAIVDERYAGELPAGVEAMTVAEIQEVLDEERPQAAPVEPASLAASDPALIVFTSGTTGEPQGVVHGHGYLPGQSLQAEHWYGAQQGELAWCTAASGWSKSSRNAFLAPWLRGAAALLHDGRFDPDERLALIERESVNVLCQAPTEYRMLAKRSELRRLPALRRLVSAGEALNPEVNERFREALGLEIHDGYGQTETGAVTGFGPGDAVQPGAMGRPLPGIEIRIEAGELQVRAASCPTFFERYVDGGEPQLLEGEWWATGDQVRSDDDGVLHFEGRDDDIIVSSGYRIGPYEVESALVSHPAVTEAAAVSAPDAERGAVVRAIVVLGAGEPSEELARELQDHVKRVTAPYKFPRIVEFADSLPKTSSGKVRRAQLRSAR